MNDVAIILAGGSGNRYGEKKQFIQLFDKPLYKHVYDKVLQILPKENIVVVGVDIEGGDTRSASVINGLEYLNNKFTSVGKVVILEAARPLVQETQIKALLSSESKSTTFVMPMVNTPIKRDGTYCNREDYFDLLTPQSFDFSLLRIAYQKTDKRDFTDETRLLFDVFEIKPKFIEGGQNLIKLTYKRDLPIIENIYKKQMEGVL